MHFCNKQLKRKNFHIVNLDINFICEKPLIKKHFLEQNYKNLDFPAPKPVYLMACTSCCYRNNAVLGFGSCNFAPRRCRKKT